MNKYFVFTLAAAYGCVQCQPLDATHSESSSSSSLLHLVMNNSSQSSNYHLTPVMSELENVDNDINHQLQAILPFLNFFFDSLFDQIRSDGDDCVNNMVIEMVPDETALPPKNTTQSKDVDDKTEAKTEPKSASQAKTDDKSTGKTVSKPGDKSTDKLVTKPDDKSTEKPVSKPDDKSSDKPVTKPNDKSTDKPVAKPDDKSTGKPVTKPDEVTNTEKPVDNVAKPKSNP